VIALANFVVTN